MTIPGSTLKASRIGRAQFQDLIARLPGLFGELVSASPLDRQRKPLPQVAGVYLFTEGDTPMYVGQTRKLRQRIANHVRPSSAESQATYAFFLALKEMGQVGLASRRGTRVHLTLDPDFSKVFASMKQRVARMDVRFVQVDDPELRTVFEVYASALLGTMNSFDTH